MKKIVSIILTFHICASVFAQSVSLSCPDFMDIEASHVVATTGKTSNPFVTKGVVNGRHTLINQQGTDPRTGGSLQLLPPSESQVIKLGNEQVGSEAEALTYHFIVDGNRPALLLKFAVVFEDPGHTQVAQPRFVVKITDSKGNMVDACAEYDVSAAANITGFQSYTPPRGTPVRWRDWTTIGLDLSPYIGQEVQVQFITYDCSQSGHFGYAYFTAHCISNILQIDNCGGADYTVEAPDNFASYLWDNGDRTRISIRSTSDMNASISCLVTSATGCQFTLYGYITNNTFPTEPSIRDTVCEGESYHQHNFELPPQNETGEKFYYNTYLNPLTCDDITVELQLTVLPRYNHIEATICQGYNYTLNGFTIMEPPIGVRYDTIWVGQNKDCDLYNLLKLTVNPSLNLPNNIIGDTSPCTEDAVTYSFEGLDLMTTYQWELPDNAVLVSTGLNKQQITIYFTDDTPANIILKGENGCGTGATPLTVIPRQAYNLFFNEHICQGNEYNDHDFNFGVQDKPGYFVSVKNLKTSKGCDSIVTLALNVLPVTEVHIEPKEIVLCTPEDEIKLLAVTESMEWEDDSEHTDSTNYPFLFIYDCGLTYLWNTGDTTAMISPKPTVTTVYTVTVTPESGCPATASQLVVVNINEPITIDTTICNGETYSLHGITYSETNNYTIKIIKDECEIPITLNLTVDSATYTTIQDTVCYGKAYTKHGLYFTLYEEGMSRDTLHYLRSTGCDSIIYLEIWVHPSPVITIYDTICQNSHYKDHDFDTIPIIAGKMTITRVLPSKHNCDSTVILNLLVNPVVVNMISDETNSCMDYEKFNFYLPELKSDTTLFQDLETSSGCDSTVILNLKVAKQHYLFEDTLTICTDDTPFLWHHKYLTKSGIYYDSLKIKITGCDSVYILNLTVTDAPSVTVVEEKVCENDTVHLIFTGVVPFELDYVFNNIRQNMTVSGMDTALIATQTGENLFIIHGLISENSCLPKKSKGVEINGVNWATCNVNMPGTFAANQENPGMF